MDSAPQNDHIFWQYLAALFLAVEEHCTAASAPHGYLPWAICNGQACNTYKAWHEIRQARLQLYSGSHNFENRREFFGIPSELGADTLVRALRGHFANKAWILKRTRGSRGLGHGRGGRNHRIDSGGSNNGNNPNPPPLPPAPLPTNSSTPINRLNIDKIEKASETPQQSHRVMSALSDLTIHPNSSTTDIRACATTPGIEVDAEGKIDSSIIQRNSNGSLFRHLWG
ncbi:hypothetical protein M422DRAFT_271646 [Sphaerobolus stellatus SS14]|uniref:Uncharacterized protein n=1 Tax=Sphaerobolus stellatus (strain SS14) TaxID=990650 RepID=A0A0C9UPE5_SPHS4|nr:hypothetical protein M422DRAFT_271646 [Sphaerobolus stellatus SS14]